MDGLLQRGVSVVRRLQAPQQGGVELIAALHEPPGHGQLLFQRFVEGESSRVEQADGCQSEMKTA